MPITFIRQTATKKVHSTSQGVMTQCRSHSNGERSSLPPSEQILPWIGFLQSNFGTSVPTYGHPNCFGFSLGISITGFIWSTVGLENQWMCSAGIEPSLIASKLCSTVCRAILPSYYVESGIKMTLYCLYSASALL